VPAITVFAAVKVLVRVVLPLGRYKPPPMPSPPLPAAAVRVLATLAPSPPLAPLPPWAFLR
jgi:hypothetical protein